MNVTTSVFRISSKTQGLISTVPLKHSIRARVCMTSNYYKAVLLDPRRLGWRLSRFEITDQFR